MSVLQEPIKTREISRETHKHADTDPNHKTTPRAHKGGKRFNQPCDRQHVGSRVHHDKVEGTSQVDARQEDVVLWFMKVGG